MPPSFDSHMIPGEMPFEIWKMSTEESDVSKRILVRMAIASFACLVAAALLAFPTPVRAEFQANGDVVTDTETGLVWMQADSGSIMNWQAALAYCEGLGYGGHSDWRLPNIRELESLVDITRYDPSIDPVFSSHLFYWSGSPYAGNSTDAWKVYFGSGSAFNGYKDDAYYVRCVRSGP